MRKLKPGHKCVECVRALLQGENSAIQAYDQVIRSIHNYSYAPELRKMRDEHVQSRDLLSQFVHVYDKIDERDAGLWGRWTRLYTRAAKLFGDGSALRALKEGEEYGLREYKAVISDTNLDLDLRKMIEVQVLPKQTHHIARLEHFTRI